MGFFKTLILVFLFFLILFGGFYWFFKDKIKYDYCYIGEIKIDPLTKKFYDVCEDFCNTKCDNEYTYIGYNKLNGCFCYKERFQ